jgi:hypothetical protein
MGVHATFRHARWHSGVRGFGVHVGCWGVGAWGSLALRHGTFVLSGIGVSGHWGVWD